MWDNGWAAEPHVSVRALILALGRFGIASKDQTRALEKAWAEYRKQHRLDIEGKSPHGSRQPAHIDDHGRGGSFARIRRMGMMVRQSKIGSSLESKELVVFDILRDSKCTECGKELGKGDFLFMEGKHPVCLSCADFDHLIYLLRGDAALTRRAKNYSALSAIVVRFSRSRGRYERQGILVEEAALERAEQECLADAQQRARRRERDEVRRAEDDRKLAAHIAEAILKLFPGCPPGEARVIAAHTALRGSGRVGRTSAGRGLETEALTAAVIAAIRHRHTRYDELLMSGYSRTDARDSIHEAVDRVIERWRHPSVSP